jgi:two-component system cell cycle response regulator
VPGKILIIDDIATNRIVLKVRLATACYQVAQAATGDEGIEIARQTRPDLIVSSARLPDMDASGLARALRANPLTSDIPLIVITADRNEAPRRAALRAGADDILHKPLDEHLLLARMRSLLRARDSEEDLHLRDGARHVLGLAEPSEGFDRPGHIAFIAASEAAARDWARPLAGLLPDRLETLPLKDAMRRLTAATPPDVVALSFGSTPDEAEAGMRLMAELRARAETRDAGIVVTLTKSDPRLAAEALDRGANDVLTQPGDPRETALRLRRQIARKHRIDRLRDNMRDGLRAAMTDALTGLHNRRYAMPRLSNIAQDAARTGRDYAVMVIDLDHFKLVNDRFGHAAGDAVLERIGDILRTTMRPDDLVARIGGEEFLVVLPETDRNAAEFAARRLCHLVREAAIAVPGHPRPLHVTVSIGVALGSDVPGAEDGGAPLPEAVVERADKALYGAKAQGRNQVTLCARRPAA